MNALAMSASDSSLRKSSLRLRPELAKSHPQSAVVRTLMDELERFDTAEELTIQLVGELRALAQRIQATADLLERETLAAVDVEEISGARIRGVI